MRFYRYTSLGTEGICIEQPCSSLFVTSIDSSRFCNRNFVSFHLPLLPFYFFNIFNMWNLDVFWGRTEARSEGWDRAHNAPSNLLTLLEYRRVTFSFFFFYDSDLIVPHLYSSLNFTASEAILKTQHSPKGPNPTPIQINSLQWSLFVASQQDWILLPSGPRSVCHSSLQILLQQEQAWMLLSTCTAHNSNLLSSWNTWADLKLRQHKELNPPRI